MRTNYRSREAIVRAASKIDQRAVWGNRDGGLVEVHQLPDYASVVWEVVRRCQYDPGQSLILGRRWADLEPIADRLGKLGVPYCLGRHDPWAGMRQFVAKLRLSRNPQDMMAIRCLVEFEREVVAIQAKDHLPELALDIHSMTAALDQVEPWQRDLLQEWIEENGDEVDTFLAWYATRDRIPELTVGAVNLLTVHSAKGLEAPIVHVVGCDRGYWPSPKADPKEERRLFYVAMTRSRDEIHLYSAEARLEWGRWRQAGLSEFLEEAPILARHKERKKCE